MLLSSKDITRRKDTSDRIFFINWITSIYRVYVRNKNTMLAIKDWNDFFIGIAETFFLNTLLRMESLSERVFLFLSLNKPCPDYHLNLSSLLLYFDMCIVGKYNFFNEEKPGVEERTMAKFSGKGSHRCCLIA